MYEDVRLEMAVKRIAVGWEMSNEDRILSFIYLFNNEGKENKEIIKGLIAKYSPQDWEIFEEADRRERLQKLIDKVFQKEIATPVVDNKSLTLEDILRKLGKVKQWKRN